MKVSVQVNRASLTMEVDTGTTLSIIGSGSGTGGAGGPMAPPKLTWGTLPPQNRAVVHVQCTYMFAYVLTSYTYSCDVDVTVQLHLE